MWSETWFNGNISKQKKRKKRNKVFIFRPCQSVCWSETGFNSVRALNSSCYQDISGRDSSYTDRADRLLLKLFNPQYWFCFRAKQSHFKSYKNATKFCRWELSTLCHLWWHNLLHGGTLNSWTGKCKQVTNKKADKLMSKTRTKLTRTSRDVGTLRHMIIVVLNYWVELPWVGLIMLKQSWAAVMLGNWAEWKL